LAFNGFDCVMTGQESTDAASRQDTIHFQIALEPNAAGFFTYYLRNSTTEKWVCAIVKAVISLPADAFKLSGTGADVPALRQKDCEIRILP
jgi:hypothetical protein